MSLWLDDKYLKLLSPTLERFLAKGPHTYNFRCPLCGDSETHKNKARGYIFAKGDTLIYKCHNCSLAMPFAALLKRQNRRLYDEYRFEKYKDQAEQEKSTAPVQPPAPKQPVIRPRPVLAGSDASAFPVYPLNSLTAPTSTVIDFAKARKLPDSSLGRLFGTQEARTWLTPLVGEKAEKVTDGVDYLVQPLRLYDGSWYGAQLRGITKKEFTTFRWSHDPLKIFGLEAFDYNKLMLVVEGPIDSLFLPNCLSACGSDMLSAVQHLEEMGAIPDHIRRVYVWDNEPRNKEITRHIRNAIKMRETVVIWPRDYPKDINDMVKAGINVENVIARRMFTGLNAELEFAAWVK